MASHDATWRTSGRTARSTPPGTRARTARCSALAVSGSTVYAGGVLRQRSAAKTRRGIAALDAQTGEATAWNPNASYGRCSRSRSRARPSTRAGRFTQDRRQGPQQHRRARYADGQGDRLEPERGRLGVLALAVSGSTVYAGGHFSVIGGETRHHIAALDAQHGQGDRLEPERERGRPGVRARGLGARPCTPAGTSARSAARARNHIAAARCADGQGDRLEPERERPGGRRSRVSGSTVYAGGRLQQRRRREPQQHRRPRRADRRGDRLEPGRGRPRVRAWRSRLDRLRRRVLQQDRRREPQQHRRARRADRQGDRLEPERERLRARARGLGLDRVRRRGLQQRSAARAATTSPPSTRRRARRPPGTRTRTTEWTRSRSRARPCTPAGSSAGSAARPASSIAALDAQTGDGDRLEPGANDCSGSGSPCSRSPAPTVYAGGVFSADRRRQAASTRIAALDAQTGARRTAWNPQRRTLAARCVALAVSGSTVYAGGMLHERSAARSATASPRSTRRQASRRARSFSPLRAE